MELPGWAGRLWVCVCVDRVCSPGVGVARGEREPVFLQ